MHISKKHEKAIRSYIRAKDNNKPHLMGGLFEDSASLTMEVKTDKIAFPSETNGLCSITNVLVKDFNQKYDNVYTFCMTDSAINDENMTLCKWAVVMTDKENETIRIGFGDYKWTFDNDLVSQLTIVIEKMIVLEKDYSKEVFSWVDKLVYPWCDSINFLKEAPSSVSFFKKWPNKKMQLTQKVCN